MSLDSSSKSPLNTWDQSITTKSNTRKTTNVTPVSVRDDWEDDDEDENEDHDNVEEVKEEESKSSSPPGHCQTLPVEEDHDENKKVWEAANTRIATPMPTLLSSRTGSVIPPPAAAFQPAMRILKRPQSSSPSSGTPTTSPPPTGESLQEREARYVAARERIFGSESSESSRRRSPQPPNSEGRQGAKSA